MKTNFWSEFFTRLKSETPAFFVTFRKWLLSLSTIAVAVIAAPQMFPDFVIPAELKTWLTYFCVAGYALGGGTFLPNKNPNEKTS